MGNLILAGGGDEHDSVEADDLLAALCDGNRTMLYVPIAMGLEHEPFDDARAWIGSVFGRRGFEITAWWGQWSMSSDEMNGYGAIYLGGGNTYRLRHWLWQQRLAEPIRSFVSQGGVIYGGSAGAIALGSDIRPCAPFDEDVVKDRRFDGLGLVHGFSIWCHYERSHDRLIQEFIDSSGSKVLAVPEKGALHVESGSISTLGSQASVIYRREGRSTLNPGSGFASGSAASNQRDA